jgi:PilC-like protein with beta-propeller domain
MSRPRQPLRGKAAAVLVLASVACFLVLCARPALPDDIDLLRFNTAKPYVFILLDTSASMSLSPSGQWVHANADDPRSKLYQAKQVLYQVFQEVDDVHFGFGYMNQDNLGVVSKHWIYYNTGALPGSWPIAYPRPDANGPVVYQADGTAVSDVQGDFMTFGSHLDATGIAGTCTAPLSLATQAEKINRYSKLGVAGNGPTAIWISSGNGGNAKTYRLTVTRPGNRPDSSTNSKLGQDNMTVNFTLEEVRSSGCTGPQTFQLQQTYNLNLNLKLWKEFLMYDQDAGPNQASSSNGDTADPVAGYWNYKDLGDTASCGSAHPFSGLGWEGNYDGATNSPPASVLGSLNATKDPYCNPSAPASCANLKETTLFDPLGRPLDRGDLLPLDWRVDNKNEFLSRLAPNQASGTPDFGISTYFQDPDPSNPSLSGTLPLKDRGQSPLVASGFTPLGKSVADFRCWYLGTGNKCNQSAYDPGWAAIAQQYDSEWGCRRPYLIVISDGDDNCPGENPCADTANLNSKADVRTWVVAFGANCNSVGNPLKCMAQNGKGSLVCPQTASDLKTELLNILGLIREEARSFASAAVPSVQATVEDKIFLTNFTPLNGAAVWDGHVHAFLKPLPLRATDNKPDTSSPNHLWDAGQVMLTSQVLSSDPLGSAANQRRVYYSLATGTTDNLTASRRLLEGTLAGVTANAIRYDLWRGLEIPFTAGDIVSEVAAETRANADLARTFAIKSKTITTTDPATGKSVTQTIQYVLGDVFHSNPVIIGNPPNTQFFATNLNGYRDFFRKHELRRKLLLVGGNDGMLHGFDAGLYDTTLKKFNNGTGKEVFAYVPREVLQTVRTLAEGTVHQWGVDGTLTVGDAYIDPKNNATPSRSWRTLAVAGLREGGTSYYALDITQPDKLATVAGVTNVPQPDNGYVPSCLGGDSGSVNATDCGPVAFPVALWEFTDSVRNAAGSPVRLDEDGNTQPDLGFTWSVPNLGRIRVTEGTSVVDKFVAIVGGGFDPDNKTSPQRGTWIYMIDVETGKAIYKRQLQGAAPSEPAGVDTNQDGYIDRIYIGTTGGQMYRIDLKADAAGGTWPALANKSVRAMDGLFYSVPRIPDTSWAPRVVFNANYDGSTPLTQPRPIYFRPSVIFVSQLGRYALSFGTGDREDLWSKSLLPGRLYTFVDDTDDLAAGTVLTEANFPRIAVTDPATSNKYLLDNSVGRRGWYLNLDVDERSITDPFALSGVSFFSTFEPDVVVSGNKDPLCSKTGFSRVFVVSTTNANSFMQAADGTSTRLLQVSTFVTNPYTEQGQTKNVETTTGKNADQFGPVGSADAARLANAMESLKSLFPRNCKFANYRIDIKTISADTGIVFIAPIPICIVEKNWKDF